MRESRRLYSLTALDINQLNFILNMIADRIDELEGRRGTPTFKSDIDMEGNKITDLAVAVADSDGLRKDQSRLESVDHSHQTTGAEAGQLDHGLAMVAASLLDDDHTGYILLIGRTGGQILQGGIAASEDLILDSTSHATKGWIGVKDPDGVLIHGWK